MYTEYVALTGLAISRLNHDVHHLHNPSAINQSTPHKIWKSTRPLPSEVICRDVCRHFGKG